MHTPGREQIPTLTLTLTLTLAVYHASFVYIYGLDEIHVVNLPRINDVDPSCHFIGEKLTHQRIHRHPYKLHYKYVLTNDASFCGNVVRMYFIH